MLHNLNLEVKFLILPQACVDIKIEATQVPAQSSCLDHYAAG